MLLVFFQQPVEIFTAGKFYSVCLVLILNNLELFTCQKIEPSGLSGKLSVSNSLDPDLRVPFDLLTRSGSKLFAKLYILDYFCKFLLIFDWEEVYICPQIRCPY